MTPKPPSKWAEWRELYLQFIRDVKGISTACEYVKEYGNIKGMDGEASNLLDKMGNRLDGFERVPLANDQRLALVFINPHLVFNKPLDLDTSKNHNYRLTKVGREAWADRIKISQEGEFGWLKKKEEIMRILEIIDAETNLIDNTSDWLEDIGDLAESIYLTNWYKFATRNGSGIPNCMAYAGSYPSRILREELNQIGPELIISFGKKPWEYGLAPAVRPIENCVKPGVTNNQNKAFQYSWRDSSSIVIPYALSRYGHFNLDEGQLQESLAHL